MNQTIAGIVDLLFKDTVVNEETSALHEELMNNCQEHYQDLINHGLSEAEAIDAVLDSLKGMKDVIAEYPKKSAAEEPAVETETEKTGASKDAEPIWQDQTEPQEASSKPREKSYSADQVKTICVNMNARDIEVSCSQDGRVHVRCEEPEEIACSLSGDVLTIRAVEKLWADTSSFSSEDFSLQGILNFVSKTLKNVSTHLSSDQPLYIEVPEQALTRLELNTKSGDISVDRIHASRIAAHTLSGDIRLAPESAGVIEHLSASSTSGDVGVRADALEAELNSISGDVDLYGGLNTVRMKSVSGDATFEGSCEKADMSAVSGDVSLRLVDSRVRRVDVHTTSGDTDIRLADVLAGVHAECSSRSGDIRCRFADAGKDAPLQIRVASISGDIRID